MRAWHRRVALVGMCWLAIEMISGATALAHDQRPGVLSLIETERGEYDLRFVPPIDSRGDVVGVVFELPSSCTREGNRALCGRELRGTIAVRGMRGTSTRTIIQLTRRDGSQLEWIASANAPEVDVRTPPRRTWTLWLRIGAEHIVCGLDHLAFLLGLLLVLGLGRGPIFDRRLLATITAFTVAHSLSLALAVTGVVQLSIAPLEACIAGSVLLVAREATHRVPTLTRRAPWLAASGFGLLHGLGVAGALTQLGLPRQSLVSSLALFNLGAEAAQLAAVGAALLVVWLGDKLLAEPSRIRPRIHAITCYSLGGVAAWWLVDRVAEVAFGAG